MKTEKAPLPARPPPSLEPRVHPAGILTDLIIIALSRLFAPSPSHHSCLGTPHRLSIGPRCDPPPRGTLCVVSGPPLAHPLATTASPHPRRLNVRSNRGRDPTTAARARAATGSSGGQNRISCSRPRRDGVDGDGTESTGRHQGGDADGRIGVKPPQVREEEGKRIYAYDVATITGKKSNERS